MSTLNTYKVQAVAIYPAAPVPDRFMCGYDSATVREAARRVGERVKHVTKVAAHADYPHLPNTLYDCEECEKRCYHAPDEDADHYCVSRTHGKGGENE